MTLCTRCGKQIEAGHICECSTDAASMAASETPTINRGEIQGFLESMKNRMGLDNPERNTGDRYERGQQIVPDSIKANEGEVPVRQYAIAILRNILRFERAEGRLQVTNKRVIFRAAGTSLRGRTTLHQEYAIDEIAGIEARNNYKFNFLYLIFALLIISAAYFIIFQYGSAGRMMHPYVTTMVKIMNPSHVQEARMRESQAIQHRRNTEIELYQVEEQLKPAEEAITRAETDIIEGILRTRRVQTGRNFLGEPVYRTETYRDTSEAAMDEAEQNLAMAISEKMRVESEIEQAKANVVEVKRAENEAINNREETERNWATFMTVLGILLGIVGIILLFVIYKRFGFKLYILCFSICLSVCLSMFGFQLSTVASGVGIYYLYLTILGILLGIGGIIPFFYMYKRFGFKLFILCFSNFGFQLSLVASGGIKIFYLFMGISALITIFCMFLYCFRPNLVISVLNKVGSPAAIDVRRELFLLMPLEKGIGFVEVIPTEESESAIREVCAIISDIQKLGDFGIEKWKK